MNKRERRRMYWVWAALVLISVVLASCANTDKGKDNDNYNVSSHVYRYVDEDAGVVCWVFWSAPASNNGSVSCMPISETMLGD